MRVIALQSGSNGNVIHVETGGVSLLFDAGISGKRADERLAERGRDIRDVAGVLISHDHADHVSCAGIYQRKFRLPLHITANTFAAAATKYNLGVLHDVRHFAAGDALQFNGVTVETVPTTHDAREGVAFVVDDGERRLGILTDLGHAFDGLHDVLASLDACFIESNFDADMLQKGPYPYHLKQRIRGPHGHLSNLEAAQLLRPHTDRLQWACLGHLSEENNDPQLALSTHRGILGSAFPLHIASRYHVSEVFEL